jgi:hypothetical protein
MNECYWLPPKAQNSPIRAFMVSKFKTNTFDFQLVLVVHFLILKKLSQ